MNVSVTTSGTSGEKFILARTKAFVKWLLLSKKVPNLPVTFTKPFLLSIVMEPKLLLVGNTSFISGWAFVW